MILLLLLMTCPTWSWGQTVEHTYELDGKPLSEMQEHYVQVCALLIYGRYYFVIGEKQNNSTIITRDGQAWNPKWIQPMLNAMHQAGYRLVAVGNCYIFEKKE